jgi:hypothetical protein
MPVDRARAATQERKRARRVLSAIAALALTLTGACGGSTFDGQVYRSGEFAFRVGPVPRSWRAIEVDGTLLAFRDDADAATVAVSGRCGLDGDDVPLEALTQHLFLHFTERTLVSQERLDLDGRAALRTELVARLDGVPMFYRVYVLKKDGCVYDLVHVSNQRDGEDFDRFARGFGTLG